MQYRKKTEQLKFIIIMHYEYGNTKARCARESWGVLHIFEFLDGEEYIYLGNSGHTKDAKMPSKVKRVKLSLLTRLKNAGLTH